MLFNVIESWVAVCNVGTAGTDKATDIGSTVDLPPKDMVILLSANVNALLRGGLNVKLF